MTMTMDCGLALILSEMVPLLVAVAVGVSRKGIPLYDKVQKSLDEVVRVMRENITGIRVIKALSKEEHEKERFNKSNDVLTSRDRKAGMVMALPAPLMTMGLNIGLSLVVVVGAIRVNNGAIKPGVILAFLTYFNMILMGVNGLNRIFMTMSKATASARRIQQVVTRPEGLEQLPEAQAAKTDSKDHIVFDHVSFSYGETLTENQQIHMSL